MTPECYDRRKFIIDITVKVGEGMAKAAEKPAAKEGEEGKKKGGGLKIIILALLVLILLGGGGFAYWYIMIHSKADHSAKVAAEAEPEDEAAPVYTPLDTFTVNLKDPGIALQTDISFKVHDEKMAEKVKQRMPEIRNQILLILSNQQQADLNSPGGKEKLAEQIRDVANKILEVKKPRLGVSQVLFTSFIMQ